MKRGILQAIALSIYILGIGTFISNANKIFPKVGNFFGPILFLFLFSTSALVCGLIVFYYPYKLFLSGKKDKALQVVVSTAVSLFFLLTILITSLLIFR